MSEPKDVSWSRHLDTIGDELLRLTTICGVRLRDPGVAERIIKNDETVCGTRNPIAFRKLRELLMATLGSIDKAVDRIGPDQTRKLIEALVERGDRQRELGGTGRPK